MLTRAFFLMKNLVFCILHINNDWFTNQGFKKYLPLAKSLTLKTKVVKRNACCIPQSLIPTETQSFEVMLYISKNREWITRSILIIWWNKRDRNFTSKDRELRELKIRINECRLYLLTLHISCNFNFNNELFIK